MAELGEYRACIGDYLRQKGIHTRKPFRCLNPEHVDRNPSMSYHEVAENVHCFSCGATYDVFDLVGMDYGLTHFAARRDKVGELFGIRSGNLAAGAEGSAYGRTETERSAPYIASAKKGFEAVSEACVQVSAAKAVVMQDRTAELDELRAKSDGRLDYFLARGVSEELCRRFGLFQSRGRAVLPLFDSEGRCLGWCARAISEAMTPRYKNSVGTLGLWRGDAPAGKLNMSQLPHNTQSSKPGDAQQVVELGGDAPAGKPNMSQLPHNTQSSKPGDAQQAVELGGDAPASNSDRPVCITEGIFDALSLIAAGYPAIALCGSQNTRKLFALLQSERDTLGARRFLCCGDGDAAGRKMNADLLEGLRALGASCAELNLPEGRDISDLYQSDALALTALLDECERACTAAPEPSDDEYCGTSALGTLDDFFAAAAFRGAQPAISTGLAKLDTALGGGLYPGFVVLGAPSSIGKTSLLLQIADAIAASGTDVLYFSLEMSRFELMAKSLSRLTALLDDKHMRHAVPARELMRGVPGASLEQQLLLRRARAEYERFAGNLFLREGLADIGADDIRTAIEEHIRRRGKRPVIFVDYLQILRPAEPRATDKQNTDRAVVELKRLSRDFDVPVVAISSFNREGYRSAACMEAFKESGAVEYSSDVLLALQLAGTGEPGFDINAAKLRDPREIELVMLKNRSGLPYAKMRLEYLAGVGIFR